MFSQVKLDIGNFKFDRPETLFLQQHIWRHYPESIQAILQAARTTIADLAMNKDLRVHYTTEIETVYSDNEVVDGPTGSEVFAISVGGGGEVLVFEFTTDQGKSIITHPAFSNPDTDLLPGYWQFTANCPHHVYTNGPGDNQKEVDAQFIFHRLRSFFQDIRGMGIAACEVSGNCFVGHITDSEDSKYKVYVALGRPEQKK